MKKRLLAAVTAAMMFTTILSVVPVNTFAIDAAEQSASAPPSEEDIQLDWLPETEAEYYDFVDEYGHLSIHDYYIVYCDKVNYSTGDEVVVNQSGDGEIKKVKEYNISDDTPAAPGSSSKVVMVYVAVLPGDVQLTISQGRTWDPNAELTEKESRDYVVNDDYTIEEKNKDDILTVSVVDYDTGELILTENDVVWPITLQAGFSVEYVLTDGTFAWGTAWADLDTWSYGQLNPFEIDTSLYRTGFGVDGFQVVDMYIPNDYFLPEDYLEINYKESDEYHTDFPADITVKLKKTIMGDVNDDGAFNVSDVVLLQKWLFAVPDTHLANWKAADFCEDDRLDVFDLTVMKRKLIEQNTAGTPDNMPVIIDYHDEVTDTERENLWMMLSGKYPDMDFSDFTFVYAPDHPLSDYYNGKLFSIYYKNILLHGYGNINCDANVFAVVGNTDAVNFVVDPKLFTQVDLGQEILSPLDVIPTCIDVEQPEMILYVDIIGENPPRLAYRAVDVRHDGEYILDAVTGESIEYIPYYVV